MTITLDDDLIVPLKDEARGRCVPLREVVTDAVRRGLAGRASPEKPITLRTWKTKLRPGIDSNGFNRLVDQLEDEAQAIILERLRAPPRRS
jgi:hypothetical protein